MNRNLPPIYDSVFGTTELKLFNKAEGGVLSCYGYSIRYDRSGNEVSRTEPTKLSSICWSNGAPFTEEDFKVLSE